MPFPVRVTVQSGLVVRIEAGEPPSRRRQFQGVEGLVYTDADPYHPKNRFVIAAAYQTNTKSWADGVYECTADGPSDDREKWKCFRATRVALPSPAEPQA